MKEKILEVLLYRYATQLCNAKNEMTSVWRHGAQKIYVDDLKNKASILEY